MPLLANLSSSFVFCGQRDRWGGVTACQRAEPIMWKVNFSRILTFVVRHAHATYFFQVALLNAQTLIHLEHRVKQSLLLFSLLFQDSIPVLQAISNFFDLFFFLIQLQLK